MRSTSSSRIFLLAQVTLVGALASCHDEAQAVDAGSLADTGSLSEIMPPDNAFDAEPEACGGVVHSAGNSPVGPFDATKVHMVRNDDARRLEVGLIDVASRASLTFTLPMDGAVSGGILPGARTVAAAFGPPLTDVSVDLDLQVVDDLLAEPSARPWGRIAAGFSAVMGGFSVTGTFDSPVCLATGTL